MKNLMAIILALFCGVAEAKVLVLDSSIYKGESVEFKKFRGDGPFSSYLQMNLPYAPMVELLDQVQKAEKVALTNRGEAHITVVTPVEFWKKLKPRNITMDQIDAIAAEMNIQSSRFEVVCVGKGSAFKKGAQATAYYVVVKSPSPDLIAIRKKIQELVIANGGSASEFEPTHGFYPHITLGFIADDVHIDDGLKKDDDTCAYPLMLK